MNFFPQGPIARRAGIFFIRRTFGDNEVYKFVMRSYIDFLVENSWYVALAAWFHNHGMRSFRATQVFKWLYLLNNQL